MIKADPAAPALMWFRDDLRLADNPALRAAVESGRPLVLLYCLDEETPGIRPLGGAARWWLHGSLEGLDKSLRRHGHALILRRGPAERIMTSVARDIGAGAVFWNRRYGAAERDVDARVKADLRAKGVEVAIFQANLLFEPWTVATKAGQPFRVFSPFWRACLSSDAPRQPYAAPRHWPTPAKHPPSDGLDDWKLLPTRPDWAGGLRDSWTPGEDGATARLDDFLEHRLSRYASHRDEPAAEATSRLSPHLRFGEVSPFQLFHAVEAAMHRLDPPPARRNVDKFLSELGWREFCWHLAFHFGDLATRNFDARFDRFPWDAETASIEAWRRGRTGYPIVDAGMRQLWRTGWMHNRVRMITASFLTKNLLADWRVGEAWFWDTLVDADAANNPAGWQWVAGSGADAAPYFRVFNPVLQGRKFDPRGEYIRRFLPELSGRAAKVHEPVGRDFGDGYPPPIVDLAASRTRALAAFATIRSTSENDVLESDED